MRKAFFVLLIIGVAIVLLFTASQKQSTQTPNTQASMTESIVSSQSTNDQRTFISGDNIIYWSGPFDGSLLSLHSNFEENLTFTRLVEKYSCKNAINSGFYTQDNRPVAMFKGSGEDILRPFRNSSLSDSVFSLNFAQTARLTKTPPNDPLDFAVQVGPMLWQNGTQFDLNIKNDELSRRMAVVTDGYNKVYFLAFVKNQSTYLGPKLSELPELIGVWAKENGIVLADAANLDGGSASAFYSPAVVLSEISPVGAIICAK